MENPVGTSNNIIKNLSGREALIKKFKLEWEDPKNQVSENILFLGPKGSGKKYVLKKIVDHFEYDINIFHWLDDCLIQKSKKNWGYNVILNFDLSFYAGFGNFS